MAVELERIETVTLRKLAELTGYRQGALRMKIHRGQLVEGKHYIRSPDGRIQIILSAWNEWVRSGSRGLRRVGRASASRLNGTGGAAGKRCA